MLFKNVIGHAQLKEKLIAGLKSGRISHAQMFIGQNGTGALPLALAYAQYVNCKNPGENDSCGTCENCRKMMVFEHPDMHFSFPVIPRKPGDKPKSTDYLPEWRKALSENPYLNYAGWMQTISEENKQGNITAEEARDIIKRLQLTALYEGYKIMLIWMPELLGKEGNILLKILEEPPANTLFLLVAQDEEQILPTILSRVQITRVPQISTADLQKALVEKLEITSDEAGRIAYLSEGNFNTALALSRESTNNYTDDFVNWMRFCFKPDMGAILKWVDAIAPSGRENQKNFIVYGLRLLREAFINGRGLSKLNHLMDSEVDFVTKFAPFVGPDNIQHLTEEFSKAHYHIERNANPKILFFNLSLQVNGLLQRQNQRA